ncbi:hypothetical protein D6T63_11175 [Arthrobacter cheniae]|uniref:Uncharacterized protein n=1 Tax=Arthrobacter cheniae TaxID=1258888 RepID=A0A3A5M6I5_9MICC|nr:hypothetical protein [Arthrobacter cheniae]RJT79172.1 hypothetical protein D6T63_11175 [Arthrobacter cheniae]
MGMMNLMPNEFPGPWLLTGTSLTFAGLAVGCLIAYLLNSKFPYDSDANGRVSAVGITATATLWRLLAIFGAAVWLVLLAVRFALFSNMPSGEEWLQAGTLAAVATAIVCQAAYLLGVLADPDKK